MGSLLSKSCTGERMPMIKKKSLFPISSGDAYIDSLSNFFLFHWRNACLIYGISRICNVRPRGIPLYFNSYKTQCLDSYRLQLVYSVVSCYGCLKCYSYSCCKSSYAKAKTGNIFKSFYFLAWFVDWKKPNKSKCSWLAHFLKHLFIKIPPNIAVKKKKRQKIYDFLTAGTKSKFACQEYTKRRHFLTEKEHFYEKGWRIEKKKNEENVFHQFSLRRLRETPRGQ